MADFIYMQDFDGENKLLKYLYDGAVERQRNCTSAQVGTPDCTFRGLCLCIHACSMPVLVLFPVLFYAFSFFFRLLPTAFHSNEIPRRHETNS